MYMYIYERERERLTRIKYKKVEEKGGKEGD